MNDVIECPPDSPANRRVFVSTFSNEPGFLYVLPDTQTRQTRVEWIVGMKLKLLGSSYLSFGTADAPGSRGG